MLTTEQKLSVHLDQEKRPTREEYVDFMAFIKANPQYRIKSRTEVNGLIFLQYNMKRRGGMHLLTQEQHGKIKERAIVWRKQRPITDEMRESNRKALILFKERNPERYRQILRRSAEKRKLRPLDRIASVMRGSLRCAVRRQGNGNYRGKYKDAVLFLKWLYVKMGIELSDKAYEIDHIKPLSSLDLFSESGRLAANSPYNVRLVTRGENLRKTNKMPTEEEILNHSNLVQQWIKEKEEGNP